MKLLEKDILTTEVFDWEGIHLLHFLGSSCSQKTRIFLNLKGINWHSHHVDLAQQENYSAWFMGINPRGLVPVLVDSGTVIIESNDILQYLETKFANPQLIPDGLDSKTRELLDAEDRLHLDLRALSMRYVFPSDKVIRNDVALANYAARGSGTIGGEPDPHKVVELAFFRNLQTHQGITDEQVRLSVARFRTAFDEFNTQLAEQPYLLGDTLSLVDIAWYIYTIRLLNAGYPIEQLHPRVGVWFEALNSREEFAKEVQEPPPLTALREAQHEQQMAAGTSLVQVAAL